MNTYDQRISNIDPLGTSEAPTDPLFPASTRSLGESAEYDTSDSNEPTELPAQHLAVSHLLCSENTDLTPASPNRLKSAKKSPLPAIDESIKNPFTTKKPLVVCLVDADGTVIKPRKDHSIALEDFNQYIIEKYPNFGGKKEARDRIRALFERYRKQEDDKLTIEGRLPKNDDLSYEDVIRESGRFYARSMEGVSIFKVNDVGAEFVEVTKMEKLFYDYALEAIQMNTDYGAYTAIVTGLPEALAKPITKKLGAHFFIAMKLEVILNEKEPIITIPAKEGDKEAFEKDGQWFREVPNLICTGNLDRNTGNKKGKNEAVGFMVNPDPKNSIMGQHAPHSILYGWGNSASDLPLIEGGKDSYHEYDLHGFGLIINPSERTWEITEEAHHRAKTTGKLRIFGEGSQKSKILEELDAKLRRVFENPRNAKKVAKILSIHGYSRREIITIFKQHYPDNPDFVMEVAGDLGIFRQTAQFTEECEALGLGDEARKIISAFRDSFQSIIPPEPARSSSWPPPSTKATCSNSTQKDKSDKDDI